MVLRRLLANSRAAPRGPAGWRAYVIGDVHGCLELLDQLLERIAADDDARSPARRLLVLLGDLIDRGPSSAQVVERVSGLSLPGFQVVGLAGNHEEVLLRILSGQAEQIAGWLRFGGAETLQSYGIDPDQIKAMQPADAQRRVCEAVPEHHRNYLESLGDTFRFGDYLFAHAGIRPGLALEQQNVTDLRWIREPFLSDSRDHGFVVVHGHTITEAVEERANRIGIDTGAYATGRLTALCIEGGERRFLATEQAETKAEESFA